MTGGAWNDYRRGYIRWTDDGDPIPAQWWTDGTVRVDPAGLLDMVRQTVATLPQYVSDADTLDTLSAMLGAEPFRGGYVLGPWAGEIMECDAAGDELGSLVMRGDAAGCVECGAPDRHRWTCRWNVAR